MAVNRDLKLSRLDISLFYSEVKSGMQRRLVKIEYDGTDFFGWQLQPGVRTVQGEMEKAVARASGSTDRVVVHGAGRTDSGVHALSQMAHFDSDATHSPSTFLNAVNYWLSGHDVSVIGLWEVPAGFHARFDVVKKTYRYSIIISEMKRPLYERYCTRLREMPNIDVLNTCAQKIRGKHDFAAFTSAGSKVTSTTRHIFESKWVSEGDLLHYYVEGNGFTYNMVRSLVGTMLEAGSGKRNVEDFHNALESRNRPDAGPTAPARGLTLYEVKYPVQL